MLLHGDTLALHSGARAFIQRQLYAEIYSHRDASAQRCLHAQKHFYTHIILHRDGFTHWATLQRERERYIYIYTYMYMHVYVYRHTYFYAITIGDFSKDWFCTRSFDMWMFLHRHNLA